MLEFFDRRDKYRKSGLEAPLMGGIGEREDVKGERGAKMERERGIRGRRWRNYYAKVRRR